MITNDPPSNWNECDLEPVTRCPVCGCGRRNELYAQLIDHLFGASGTWNLYQCDQCSSAYLDPRPTQRSIGRAYANYYTHTASDVPSSLFKYLSRAARNGYINKHWLTQLKPSSRTLGYAIKAFASLRAKVDNELMRSVAPDANVASVRKVVLDVGCGSGQFLSLMKSAGWNARGIDFDEKAVAAAQTRGLSVTLGGLEVLNQESENYDLITLSHVIEHIYDPHDALRQCFRLLRRGGCLWIETPNLHSQGHQIYGRHWRGLEPPRHLVLFTGNALKDLLHKNGFINITTAPWRPQYRALSNTSKAIAKKAVPIEDRFRKYQVGLFDVLTAERQARRYPECREFITFMATKP